MSAYNVALVSKKVAHTVKFSSEDFWFYEPFAAVFDALYFREEWSDVEKSGIWVVFSTIVDEVDCRACLSCPTTGVYYIGFAACCNARQWCGCSGRCVADRERLY